MGQMILPCNKCEKSFYDYDLYGNKNENLLCSNCLNKKIYKMCSETGFIETKEQWNEFKKILFKNGK